MVDETLFNDTKVGEQVRAVGVRVVVIVAGG